MQPDQERRRHPRFLVKEGTLAINDQIVGPVINISLGGMAFEYYDNDMQDAPDMDMGIFFSETGFLLTNLTSEAVYEETVDSSVSFLPLIRKRTSIKFVDLTPTQRQKLLRFIDNHTCGLA